jgi:hypothetical protein
VVCPEMLLAVILSQQTGINIGLCLKIIYTDKISLPGEDTIMIKLKLIELDQLGSALDFDIGTASKIPEPPRPGQDAFQNKVEGNWINYREVRPIFDENLIMFRFPEYRDKILKSGKDCFKTLIDIVYARNENINWFLTPLNKKLMATVMVDGTVKIGNTENILFSLMNKYTDFIINMCIYSGMPIAEVYDNLGIKINSDGVNINFSNERIEEHYEYMYKKVHALSLQAIKNVNLFDKVRHKLMESDPKLLCFDKYSLWKSDIIFTYKEGQLPNV